MQHPCLDFGTPMQVLITEHRRILDAIEASPPFDGDCEELVALDNAEWDALKAVIAAPCSNRADALAVLQHFRPYVAAQGNAFGGALRDFGEVTCTVAETILRALAVALGEDEAGEGLCVSAMAGHPLATAQHSANLRQA